MKRLLWEVRGTCSHSYDMASDWLVALHTTRLGAVRHAFEAAFAEGELFGRFRSAPVIADVDESQIHTHPDYVNPFDLVGARAGHEGADFFTYFIHPHTTPVLEEGTDVVNALKVQQDWELEQALIRVRDDTPEFHARFGPFLMLGPEYDRLWVPAHFYDTYAPARAEGPCKCGALQKQGAHQFSCNVNFGHLYTDDTGRVPRIVCSDCARLVFPHMKSSHQPDCIRIKKLDPRRR